MTDLNDYLANASPDVQELNAHLLPQPKRPSQFEKREAKKKRPPTAVKPAPELSQLPPVFPAFSPTPPVTSGSTGYVEYDPSWGMTDEWTGTEKRFAREYLLPLVLDGTYLWIMPQVEVYMIGQRYTFDFVALRADGGADHYEVKGSYQLGSEDRASTKIRWATSFLRGKPDSLHRVFWVAWRSMRGHPVAWHVREIHPNRKLNPVFEE